MVRLLGAKLRLLRLAQEPPLSQSAFAAVLGVSRYLVNNVESNRKRLSLPLLARTATCFHVTLLWLTDDTIPVDSLPQRPVLDHTVQRPILRLFPEKVRYQRIQHGLTQTDLAQQLHLRSQSHVSELESGTDAPSLDLLLELARLFGQSPDYFVFDDIGVDAGERW